LFWQELTVNNTEEQQDLTNTLLLRLLAKVDAIEAKNDAQNKEVLAKVEAMEKKHEDALDAMKKAVYKELVELRDKSPSPPQNLEEENKEEPREGGEDREASPEVILRTNRRNPEYDELLQLVAQEEEELSGRESTPEEEEEMSIEFEYPSSPEFSGESESSVESESSQDSMPEMPEPPKIAIEYEVGLYEFKWQK